MPRTPDPELEDRIAAAAMRLLDRGGEVAITMRAVAQEAGTTTPTLYERFPDREALMRRVARRATDEMFSVLQSFTTVDKMAREYLRFSCAHPRRFDLTVEVFGERSVAGESRPVFELLKSRLTEEVGVTGSKCEDLALALPRCSSARPGECRRRGGFPPCRRVASRFAVSAAVSAGCVFREWQGEGTFQIVCRRRNGARLSAGVSAIRLPAFRWQSIRRRGRSPG